MDDGTKRQIEEAVNSREVEEYANSDRPWEDIFKFILAQTHNTILTEDEEARLYRDLRDWWKNGNLMNHEPDLAWELGDPDFWG